MEKKDIFCTFSCKLDKLIGVQYFFLNAYSPRREGKKKATWQFSIGIVIKKGKQRGRFWCTALIQPPKWILPNSNLESWESYGRLFSQTKLLIFFFSFHLFGLLNLRSWQFHTDSSCGNTGGGVALYGSSMVGTRCPVATNLVGEFLVTLYQHWVQNLQEENLAVLVNNLSKEANSKLHVTKN